MHPAIEHILQFFKYDHLPEDLQQVARMSHAMAREMVKLLPESPELTAGLRKLLEAKDCFVRARLSHD